MDCGECLNSFSVMSLKTARNFGVPLCQRKQVLEKENRSKTPCRAGGGDKLFKVAFGQGNCWVVLQKVALGPRLGWGSTGVEAFAWAVGCRRWAGMLTWEPGLSRCELQSSWFLQKWGLGRPTAGHSWYVPEVGVELGDLGCGGPTLTLESNGHCVYFLSKKTSSCQLGPLCSLTHSILRENE